MARLQHEAAHASLVESKPSAKRKSCYEEPSSSKGHISGPDPADSIDVALQKIEHLGSLDIKFASSTEYSEHSDQTESRLLPSLLPNMSDMAQVHPSAKAASAAAPADALLLYGSMCRMDELADALQVSSRLCHCSVNIC